MSEIVVEQPPKAGVELTVEIEAHAADQTAQAELDIKVETETSEQKEDSSEEVADDNMELKVDDPVKTNRFSDSFINPPEDVIDAAAAAETKQDEEEITVVKERAVDVGDGDGDKDKLLSDGTKKTKDGTLRRSGEKSKNTWEEFTPTSKPPKTRLKSMDSDPGGICADDPTTSGQWTALDDSERPGDDDDELQQSESGDVPFRRFKSERVEKHRAARIIETLNTRRLSNTSLDLESRTTNAASGTTQQGAEGLLAPLNAGRAWDVYLKLDRKIPGTRTKWLPVSISVKDSAVIIKRSTAPEIASGKLEDNELVKEVYLHHNNTVSKPKLKHYDRNTKIHQIKLQVRLYGCIV